MAEDDEVHRPPHRVALLPEQFVPRKPAQHAFLPGISEGDEETAFINQRQRVAQRTAPVRRVVETILDVQGVDARLGLGEGEPGAGVKGVVPGGGPGLDFAVLVNTALEIEGRGWRIAWCNKAQRHAAHIFD